MKNKIYKKIILFISLVVTIVLVTGCQSSDSKEKVFYYGDTTFNAENDEPDVNPHNGYAGWACIRYGVGETLFKYSDQMELEPWLAKEYKNINDNTWEVVLQDNVTFANGRKMNGQAVKECLEHLIANHERARGDLKITEIKADKQIVTIVTKEPVPALMNYLSDPYGCIIDIEAGISDDGNVVGTGPYQAIEIETDKGLTLIKNDKYWDGTPHLDKIYVETISDGDTLTMAMQSGQLDAAYGLPYTSLPLFAKEPYQISSIETSRTFFGTMNYKTAVLQDPNVREAIVAAIDKDNFTEVLLDGNGIAAIGPFPINFTNNIITSTSYDLKRAEQLLATSNWIDSDGDGYVEKDGQILTIRWLTYPSRQELPLLAESVQASLKKIGIKVEINNTANHLDFINRGEWDIYASAFVTAPTGDPEYFFTTHCLDASSKNRGNYHSDDLERLEKQLNTTFDAKERVNIADQMTQIILDDHAFFFASHLKMSIVAGKGVTGLKAHASDYYEITVDLDKN